MKLRVFYLSFYPCDSGFHLHSETPRILKWSPVTRTRLNDEGEQDSDEEIVS
jgi:hypothetical protein